MVVSLLILAFLGFLYLNRYPTQAVLSASQKEKELEKLLGRTPILSPTSVQQTKKKYTSKYIQFYYPVYAKVYKTDDNYPILDSFSFGIVDEHIIITMQVTQLDGTESIENAGPVIIRSQDSNYHKTTAVYDGHTCLVFTKDGDTKEKSLFCLQGNMLLSVVGTGANLDSISSFLDPIWQSLIF